MTALALVACNAAGADPAAPASRDGARPEGWKQLPAIATAVEAAARTDAVTIDRVDAWGEPARGCYAVWLALHGAASEAPVLAEQVLAGLAPAAPRGAGPPAQPARPQPRPRPLDRAASPPGGLSISDVERPTSPVGVLAFAFASPPYRGRVRAQLGAGRIDLTACFGNQREPRACETTCARVLEAAP